MQFPHAGFPSSHLTCGNQLGLRRYRRLMAQEARDLTRLALHREQPWRVFGVFLRFLCAVVCEIAASLVSETSDSMV